MWPLSNVSFPVATSHKLIVPSQQPAASILLSVPFAPLNNTVHVTIRTNLHIEEDAQETLPVLRRTLGVELPKVALFQAPTVRALARYLESAGAGGPPAAAPLADVGTRAEPETNEAVAIVGMGLRFPGARVAAFND